MTAPLPARYCDGETLRSRVVEIHPLPGGALRVVGGDLDRELSLARATITSRLGSIPRFLRFPDGAVLEIPDSPELTPWLDSARPPRRFRDPIHWLESRAAVAAVATLLVVAGAVAAFWQGLPRLARRAAYAVPVGIETQAGEAAYRVFAQSFARSSLDYNQQRRIQLQLDRLAAARPLHLPPKLVFLSMRTPNAFALPGGLVVVTDELVALAHNDDEISAVLAHELGHIERRHGLQSVLRNSSALIIVSTLTGDLSTLTTFSGTLPFLLLQYGYARTFEEEADAFAVDLLRAARIEPVHLASILETLDRARPKGGADFSYLSTHPSTPDRLQKIDPANRRHARLQGANAAAHSIAQPPSALSARPEVDAVPVVRTRNPPQYPPGLRAVGIEGEVLLEFIVDTDGRVRNPRVVRSSHPGFEAAALACVKDWTFQPGQKNGRAVNTRMQQPLAFTLEDDVAAPAPAAPTPLDAGDAAPRPAP